MWRSSRTRSPPPTGAPGDDAIHFQVAKALTGEDFRGALLDAPAGWEDFAAPGGFEGGILGVDSAAMDFVAQQDAGEPGLQLALQPTVRKTVKPREGTHAQRLAPTPHVLAPMFFKAIRPSHVQCSLTRGNALYEFMSAFLLIGFLVCFQF